MFSTLMGLQDVKCWHCLCPQGNVCVCVYIYTDIYIYIYIVCVCEREREREKSLNKVIAEDCYIKYILNVLAVTQH